jgi:hypothetical protein
MASRIESLPGMLEIVDSILASTAVVERDYRNTAATVASKRILAACMEDLKRLEQGHILTDYEDISILMDQIAQTRTSVRATSLQEIDLRWWLSTLGRRYSASMVEAINRGVHVERIFIYNDWNSDLDRLANEQYDTGVHVLKVRRDELPSPLRIDMIVWDGRCAYEAQVSEPGGAHRNSFRLNKEDVDRKIATFNTIYDLAEDLKGDLVRCNLH